ncbi:DNA oxidative demethylase AlkB [Enterobacteriaceae bacterium YMB-R22]|uniref:DNA oxidative demethylase AlkB n=1 Tax=Tenebrionicola larvae TaxID=2815733 RepID=UPI0020134EB5|nr:DNA oxidative demethylase AlkB [Tenebrionicola larvae]MBV4411953.1 DNA oxidative demethylase AlkB [Tenebrionicola larvae]
MLDLFADELPWREALAEGAVILRRFATREACVLLALIAEVAKQAPFRRMATPGGHTMSVAMTGCGERGWVSDARGYRYSRLDPQSALPWPPMPNPLLQLAKRSAGEAGYTGFHPDACLINRYEPGAKMSLHQDRDESNLRAPIVSVSLGLPARFLFGGATRTAPTQRCLLEHGDVVVWGGASRLFYHGVQPLRPGNHPLTGAYRYNLTFREAG